MKVTQDSGSLLQKTERTCAFHIHLDGAGLPSKLERYAKEKYGFFDDDFDHRLFIRGKTQSVAGRQLTLKVADPLAKHEVQAIFEDLKSQAAETRFEGLIQSEYVMSESVLSSRIKDYQHTPFPFYVHLRRINQAHGEKFKTHELHLEFSQELTEPKLITEIARSGMSIAFGPCEITFTVSGRLNDIRGIAQALFTYLNVTHGFDKAKLTLEATLFHSLHEMAPEDTPLVVSRLEYLQ